MDNHRGDRIASPPFPVMFLFFFFSSMKHARAGLKLSISRRKRINFLKYERELTPGPQKSAPAGLLVPNLTFSRSLSLHNNFLSLSLSRDSFYYCSKNAYLNRVQHRQTDRQTHARDEHRMSLFDDVIVRD